jgi:hypothetical protein
MGGFVFDAEILSLRRIEQLVEQNEIEYPIVSREEIQDRSKGDAITKALVVFQTTWFLLQCAVRAIQHLAVTELELATAAFAVLNIISYVLWWDKPLDVECHIRVRRRSGAQDDARNPTHSEQAGQDQQNQSRENIGSTVRALNWRSCCRGWTLENILELVAKALNPFFAMMGADVRNDVFSVVGEGRLDNKPIFPLWIWGTLVTTVFGAIHCIGWSFDFPSHTERVLWRVSSVASTGLPLAFAGVRMQCAILADTAIGDNGLTLKIVSSFLPLILFLYFISRIVLLVLSFSTLRFLPLSALQTVEWTTFLPHV